MAYTPRKSAQLPSAFLAALSGEPSGVAAMPNLESVFAQLAAEGRAA